MNPAVLKLLLFLAEKAIVYLRRHYASLTPQQKAELARLNLQDLQDKEKERLEK